jgi:predicted RNA-binding Zn-ribbon protein involved in translation (DUF1610 family)
MSNCKYTCEMLRPIFESSLSYAEVLRRLSLKQTGGSQSHIKRLAQKFGISTDHFLGQVRNQGEDHRGGPKKAKAEEILVLRDPLSHHEQAVRLRRAMIEVGIPYRCESCGLEDVWNGKPLLLTIDHINGHRYDNRRENLRFLCPNCHSQTPTFGRSLGLTDVTSRKRYFQHMRKQKAAKRE